MKALFVLIPALFLSQAFAADVPAKAAPDAKAVHRYLIERTFPAGALDGLDAAGKAKINATNAKYGVRWVTSYANANKTKTYCIYEGPSEDAARAVEPFFTTKPIGQGTGLGLAITNEIVKAHRGTLNLSPKEPRGTRVAIEVPIARHDAKERAA